MRACLNCQKRKSRCLRRKSEEPCVYCRNAGKTCSLDEAPSRTPLTRKNLDAAERLCEQLTSLLRSSNPNIDIGRALKQADQPSLAQLAAPGEPHATSNNRSHDRSALHVDRSYALQQHASTSDGMANFSKDGSGYLGSSSGSSLLQDINAVLPSMPDETASSQQSDIRSVPDNRTLPNPPDLIGGRLADSLVDSFFLLYNSCYPIIHENSFRRKLAQTRPDTSSERSWRVLYYMILTIGYWISSHDTQCQAYIFEFAQSNLSLQMVELGSIETVQCFLLMGNYLQKVDRTNIGYNYIGLAYRIAVGLGLHLESPNSRDIIANEIRRRLFWTLYCFESGFNITLGRPPSSIQGFTDVHYPRNVDDKDLIATDIVPDEQSTPTTYSSLIAQARLARIADAIYREFLLAKTAGTLIEHGLAEYLDRELERWHHEQQEFLTGPIVPVWFMVPRSVVSWKAKNLRILLWRGTKNLHAFLPSLKSAADRYLNAAMDSIHSIASFCQSYKGSFHQGLNWYATYFIFQAALVVEAGNLANESWTSQTVHEQPRWQLEHSCHEARSCLRKLAESNGSANRCLKVLEQIYRRSLAVSRGQKEPVATCMTDVRVDVPPEPAEESRAQMDPEQISLSTWNGFTPSNDTRLVTENGYMDTSFLMLINDMSADLGQNMPLDLLFGS